VDLSAGTFVHLGIDVHTVSAIDSTATNIIRWFHDAADNWATDTNAQIDAANWDDPTDGAGIQPNANNKYYRSIFYTDGTYIHWLYPQEEFNTLAQAIAGDDPEPPDYLAHFPSCTVVIMKGDDAAFPAAGSDQWIDVRPTLAGAKIGGIVTDHGGLSGLGDDDHTQYLLVSGVRAMAGNLDMGGNQITNVGNVDGVDVSAHAARHELGGADQMSIDLNDLSDVNAGAPNDDDVLTWDDIAGEWVPAAGGGGGGVSETDIQFLDNFNDASLHWGWCDQANNGTIVEASNVLTLAVANGVDGRIGDAGRNKGPHVALGSPGDPFEVKCKLNSYTVNDYTHAGLFISVDTWIGYASSWLFFGRGRDSGFGMNGLGVWGNGNWLNTNGVTTLPIYLRIRLSALNLACGCYTMDYSTDDITYTNLRTATISNDLFSNYKDGLCIGLFCRNGVGTTTYNAISAPFDWYYQRRSFGPG